MGGVALTGQFATAAGEQEKIVLYVLTLFLLGVRRGVGSAKSQNFDNGRLNGGYDQPARSRLSFWVPSVYLLAGNRIAGPPSTKMPSRENTTERGGAIGPPGAFAPRFS